jgi:maleylacetoacetate isomerase
MNKVLYDYWRSSSSVRVRIALALKNIAYQNIPVSLINNEQQHPDYLRLNPQGLVPFWQDDKIDLSQSLAIVEYLDEQYPLPKLLPDDVLLKARARQYAYIIACDMHPLNNLRVKKYLNIDEKDWLTWYHHWLALGFEAYEALLDQHQFKGPFTLGNHLSLADICLIPQIYNAKRFGFKLAKYTKIQMIYDSCMKIDAFKDAMPEDYLKI